MKILATLLLIAACFSLTACNKGSKINGHTQNTALKSVRYLKERLPPEKRIEFEVSYFTLRDSIKDNGEFLSAIDGKTPDQIIEEGKRIYTDRRNQGLEKYTQYTSWEDMIAKFSKEKDDQSRKHKPDAEKEKEKYNATVLYKL